MQVRLASVEDTGRLATLVNRVYRGESSRSGWTTEADLLDGQRTDPAALLEFLSRPATDALMLIGESQGNLLACLQLTREDSEAHLGMLSVDASRQNQGLGKQMIAAAERHAREHWQASSLALAVIHLRHELIDWYLRRGFLPTGERSEFPYGDPRFGLPKRDDLWFTTLRKSLLTS